MRPPRYSIAVGVLEQAEQCGDAGRARDLQQQVSELEEKAKKIECLRTKSLSAISAINQRNRDHMKQSFLGTGLARMEEREKDDDPFTRKSARMKVVAGAARFKTAAEGGNAGSSSISTVISSRGSVSSSSDTSSPSKKVQQLPSAHDLFNAHGIDINIDIKVPAVAGGSFRAPPIADSQAPRMQQKASSSRTLTLEEYKKKRGLV
ncbi:RNA polymerase-associated protein rtf1 [Globodera pallida]|uniref:TLK2 n=1 Tax=Globodera pallida TaxID=36090 RepID=A0A183BYI2_GLOPA|nr:RNA polymerase-associated protein rtf1 [Globodera pallida]